MDFTNAQHPWAVDNSGVGNEHSSTEFGFYRYEPLPNIFEVGMMTMHPLPDLSSLELEMDLHDDDVHQGHSTIVPMGSVALTNHNHFPPPYPSTLPTTDVGTSLPGNADFNLPPPFPGRFNVRSWGMPFDIFDAPHSAVLGHVNPSAFAAVALPDNPDTIHDAASFDPLDHFATIAIRSSASPNWEDPNFDDSRIPNFDIGLEPSDGASYFFDFSNTINGERYSTLSHIGSSAAVEGFNPVPLENFLHGPSSTGRVPGPMYPPHNSGIGDNDLIGEGDTILNSSTTTERRKRPRQIEFESADTIDAGLSSSNPNEDLGDLIPAMPTNKKPRYLSPSTNELY
jgi:hypothetical protein